MFLVVPPKDAFALIVTIIFIVQKDSYFVIIGKF